MSKRNSGSFSHDTYIYVSDLGVSNYLGDSCRSVRCGDRDEVEDPFGKTRLVENLGDKIVSSGCVLVALEYDSVPNEDRDGNRPHSQSDWDVPRTDGKTRGRNKRV